MFKVAVLNLKGGIGKTTTATSLAHILAVSMGKKVLLIDCDMQGNASKIYDVYNPEGTGTHSIMTGKADINLTIRGTGYAWEKGTAAEGGKLHIIPANMYLMQANAEVLTDTENEQLHRLADAVKNIKFTNYDFVIFDCALGLDMTVLNAVIASDMVIAPVPFGGYEIDGLNELSEQLEDMKGLNPDLRLKVLFAMRQGNKTNREFETWLKNDSGYEVFENTVRRSVIVQRATVERVPLPEYSKRGITTQDYKLVAFELMEDARQHELTADWNE